MQPEARPAWEAEAPRRPLPEAHEPACRRLVAWLQERRGFTLVVGPEGVGKGELLRHVCHRLPDGFEVAFVRRPRSAAELCAALLPAAAGAPAGGAGPESVAPLLRARAEAGRWTVLVVDGADDLDAGGVAALDGLAALEPMLQLVVLTSADEGPERVAAEGLERPRATGVEALAARGRQRERLRCLTREEADAYARALIAPGQPPLSDAAAAEVAVRSAGLAERVASLVAGAVEAARTHWLREVTRECVEVGARAAGQPPAPPRLERAATVAQAPAPAESTLASAPGQDGLVADPGVRHQRRRSDRRRLERRGNPRAVETGVQPPSPPAPAAGQPEPGVAMGAETVLPVPAPPSLGAAAPAAPIAGRPAGVPPRRGVPDRSDPFRSGRSAPAIDTPELLPVLSDPHSACTEWFRVLRVRLDDWIRQHGGVPKVIAFTSPSSDAGKTVVTANLALLWAQNTSERVLLVDGDLRRPQHHAVFDLPRRPGFADLLAQRVEVAEAAAFVSEVNLWVMPAGRPGNPRQLANPDRVHAGLDALRGHFDLILLDAPPLAGLVDARSMAGAADGVVMVVRAGKTRFPALQRSLEFLASDNLVGTVVNAVDTGVDSAYAEYRRSARGR